jgi:hypothetical protein
MFCTDRILCFTAQGHDDAEHMTTTPMSQQAGTTAATASAPACCEAKRAPWGAGGLQENTKIIAYWREASKQVSNAVGCRQGGRRAHHDAGANDEGITLPGAGVSCKRSRRAARATRRIMARARPKPPRVCLRCRIGALRVWIQGNSIPTKPSGSAL